jgi:uncharacterized protein YpiB (UPF0302 family)
MANRFGVPSKTLYDHVVFCWEHDRRKHDLDDDHVQEQLAQMSHEELLRAISDALEEAGVTFPEL